MTSWLNWRDTSIQTTGDGGGCEVQPVAAGVRSVWGGVCTQGTLGSLFFFFFLKSLYYLGLCQAEIGMENTQDLRRQVPRSRKIRPRRVQAEGLDLITLCCVCPRSGDKNPNLSPSVGTRRVPETLSLLCRMNPDANFRND